MQGRHFGRFDDRRSALGSWESFRTFDLLSPDDDAMGNGNGFGPFDLDQTISVETEFGVL